MLLSQKWRLLLSLFAFSNVVPHLSAVIAEDRLYHGKMIQCLHGGAWLFQDLGVYSRARLYKEQVFTGTIQSAVEISFTDKRLEIVPDEVLLGDVSGEITATVNQACLSENLPEIQAGDRWLFFLRTLYRNAIPYHVVDFDSPAKPASLSGYELCLLRLRSDLDESCIALMPARPSKHRAFCALKLKGMHFPLTNPFPRSSPLPEPEIKLAQISPPPEFRTHEADGLNTTGVTLQTRGLFSCSPHDD